MTTLQAQYVTAEAVMKTNSSIANSIQPIQLSNRVKPAASSATCIQHATREWS